MKPATSILVESSTFRFRDQFAMHLAEDLGQEHRWVPNSGRITLQIRGEDDFTHAPWLIRLSYLRYMLKTTNVPLRHLGE